MKFEKALELIRGGAKVRRHNWAKTKFIKRFDRIDDDGKLTGEVGIAAKFDDIDNGIYGSWTPSTESLLATDWETVEPVMLELDVVKSQQTDKTLVFRCNRNFMLSDDNLNAIDSAVNEGIAKLVGEGKLDIF